MKVLVYTHEFPPFLGGLATTSYKLVKGFIDSGIEVSALVPSYNNDEKEVDRALSCNVRRIPLLGTKILRSIPFLQQFIALFFLAYSIKKHKPDAVLFITEEAESTGGILSCFMSFRSVVRVAGSGIMTCILGDKKIKKLHKYPMMRLYGKAKKVIAVSNYTKSLLMQIGVEEDKIRVVFNGIDEKFLSEKKDEIKSGELKTRFGIRDKDKVLITIARILPRKGQDYVIRALPKVIEEFPDVKYLIVGEGKYKHSFKDLASELGLEGVVVFTGGVDHKSIINYLDIGDIFIMPNRMWNNKVEGLPNALMEASARGLATIAGNQSGSVEAIIDGKTGYLVDSESVDEITNCIINLIGNEEKIEELGKNGVDFVKEYFREEMMIKNYIEVLKEAAQQ